MFTFISLLLLVLLLKNRKPVFLYCFFMLNIKSENIFYFTVIGTGHYISNIFGVIALVRLIYSCKARAQLSTIWANIKITIYKI